MTETNVITFTTFDPPPVSRGFENIADAADQAMLEVLMNDLCEEVADLVELAA